MKRNLAIALLAATVFAIPAISHAQQGAVRVDAKANVFAVTAAALSDGQPPTVFRLPEGRNRTVMFTNVVGTVSCCSGENPNGPEGGSNYAPTNVTSSHPGLSDINHSQTMFLAAVFVADGAPGGDAPQAIDGASNRPQLNQVFYVGNGSGGEDSGSPRRFLVPDGATRILLGFADAGGFSGAAAAYADNTGAVSLDVVTVQAEIADGWLGKWSGASSYSETEQVWNWWFAVSRSCDGYRIQTHTSGPEKVEILNISATELEFLFHDELGTRISISKLENDVYAGKVSQPNNSALPSGRVDGRKIGEAASTRPALSEIEIVDPGSLQPLEETQIGEALAVRLTYSDAPCEVITETVTITTPDGRPLQVDVTGNDRVIVSRPISVAPVGH